VEVVVACALTALLATGLYGAVLMAVRAVHFNRLAIAGRCLATERMEEVAAAGVDGIALQAPYAELTNRMETGYESDVITWVEVIGHGIDGAPQTNLAGSAYVEVHSFVAFESPFTEQMTTNCYSSIVR